MFIILSCTVRFGPRTGVAAALSEKWATADTVNDEIFMPIL
jgi:hypothetical protein